MIISKTPYRISFFGGGTDYPTWYLKNGGSVLSTTIDKYIYISCRNLPPFFKHKYRIVWSHIELPKKIDQIKHNSVREMLKLFKFKQGLEIHYDGDLPSRSGMGSSSVFIVGLMNLFNSLKGKSISKKNLALDSINFEQKILKEVVGSQDQIAAAYGGFNKIVFQKSGNFKLKSMNIKTETMKRLNKNLLLVYTGFKRTAHEIASTYVNKLEKSKKQNILEISTFVKEAEKILKRKDLNDFGSLLNESWKLKRSLSSSMTNLSIDDIYNDAIKKGAVGGKILGAGGGGFFLFYVPHFKQKKFIKHFKKLVNVPFNFSSSGSEIMFKRLDNKF
tara:strand:+ start:814 stop:1809 length:996 start_codon:yes stop_codon:yes gene_type:complete